LLQVAADIEGQSGDILSTKAMCQQHQDTIQENVARRERQKAKNQKARE
jgi:hypothetical protein